MATRVSGSRKKDGTPAVLSATGVADRCEVSIARRSPAVVRLSCRADHRQNGLVARVGIVQLCVLRCFSTGLCGTPDRFRSQCASSMRKEKFAFRLVPRVLGATAASLVA